MAGELITDIIERLRDETARGEPFEEAGLGWGSTGQGKVGLLWRLDLAPAYEHLRGGGGLERRLDLARARLLSYFDSVIYDPNVTYMTIQTINIIPQ